MHERSQHSRDRKHKSNCNHHTPVFETVSMIRWRASIRNPEASRSMLLKLCSSDMGVRAADTHALHERPARMLGHGKHQPNKTASAFSTYIILQLSWILQRLWCYYRGGFGDKSRRLPRTPTNLGSMMHAI